MMVESMLPLELKPADRILITPVPETLEAWIDSALQTLTAGLLVGIDTPDRVAHLRTRYRNFDNCMFVPDDPATGIPWRDAFFTIAIAPADSPELRRVLTPDGRLVPLVP
jgi:hypothetical protein